jgi:hypothetical protein
LVSFFLVEEKRSIRTQKFRAKKIFLNLFAYPPDMSEMSGRRALVWYWQLRGLAGGCVVSADLSG